MQIEVCEVLSAGDVVCAASPVEPNVLVTKRVVGLEGDVLSVPPQRGFDTYRVVQVGLMPVLICGPFSARVACTA